MKKAIIVILVIFVVYFLLTNPTGSADVVELAFDGIVNAFDQVATFVQNLLF